MTRLCLLLLSFTWAASYAQTDSIQYFDGSDRPAQSGNAAYYRKISKQDTGKIYLGVEYWIDGRIKMIGHALDANFVSKIGKYTYYYKNGNKSGEGQYYSDPDQRVYGFKNKKWETWYPNGKPKEEWIYRIADDFSSSESFLMSFWDTAGSELTAKGEGNYYFTDWIKTKDTIQKVAFTGTIHKGRFDGLWLSHFADGREYAEDTYRDGKFEKGKSFDVNGNSYTYDSLETTARFPGGDDGLKKFLKLNIVQPKVDNRRTNWLGAIPTANDEFLVNTVYVWVLVERNGFVGGVSLQKGVNDGLDKEAMRVARAMPRFTPGTLRGQPVDSYVLIPIPFTKQ